MDRFDPKSAALIIQDLQNERDMTLSNLTASNAKPLAPLYADTNNAIQAVQQSTAGIGTPHARWRDTHQSGRFATML